MTALAGFGVGLEVTLEGLFGRGLIPVAWAEDADLLATKDGMTLHNKQPINGEFLPHLLDHNITPPGRHFVRNNGMVPERALKKSLQEWKLTIDGEVHRKLELSMADLLRFPQVTLPLVVECGGNGRANFDPKVRGNPWNRGAIGCSAWTGVPLVEVLKQAGLQDTAVYTGHYGEDPPLAGQAEPFSRGIPIGKAMERHTLIAIKMGDQDLPALNGFPVRLVVPGWVGSASQKWLNRIWVRDREHDSKKMTGYAYRVPAYPVVPGVKPPESDMRIATAWHIKSIITRPVSGTQFKVGQPVLVRGHAWAGEDYVTSVLVSIDYGVSWKPTRLLPGPNRYAWATWDTTIVPPGKGYFEVWARAYDDKGRSQPFHQPWNPKGYLGNVVHRVPVVVQG